MKTPHPPGSPMSPPKIRWVDNDKKEKFNQIAVTKRTLNLILNKQTNETNRKTTKV